VSENLNTGQRIGNVYPTELKIDPTSGLDTYTSR